MSWIPIVVCFLVAAGILFWKKQKHFAGFITFGVVGGLGVSELWAKLQTGHTISQNFIKEFFLIEPFWAWTSLIFILLAIIFLILHLTWKVKK